MSDFKEAITQNYLWRELSWNDVRARYRRSTLGPFWITLSMAVTISAMGPLYGALFNFDPSNFVPHLGLGLIFWAYMSSTITESCNTFIDAQHYLKQTKISFIVFVFRVIYRQLIVLMHNILLYPIIMLILGLGINWNILYVFPGLALVSLNLIWISILFSLFCTRYRDMLQVVNSIISLLFFVTPIIWKLEQLPEDRKYLAGWNLFSYFLDLLRSPLLGVEPRIDSWVVALYSAIIGFIFSFICFAKVKNRITYWL